VNKEKLIGPIQRDILSVAHLQKRRLELDILVAVERDDSIFVLLVVEHI